MAAGWLLAVKHQQSLEQLLQGLLRQKTPVFLRKCRGIQGSPEAAQIQLLALAQGPRHHMPAGARQALGILFPYHHQQIEVGIGPRIPPRPGAKQQHSPWPGLNPGQGGCHRLQVGIDCGGWERHLCRVGRSLGSEPIGIQQGYPAISEIGCVSCHDGEAMQERNRGDLLVDPMLRIRHPQPPPQLGSIAIQADNTIAIVEQPAY